MKLTDLLHDPSSITPRYPIYPEKMEGQIKNFPAPNGDLYVLDFIENRTPRIFDGYDQIKVRPALNCKQALKKSKGLPWRKALFETVTIIDRKGYEERNRKYEEMLIRQIFFHLVINVFGIGDDLPGLSFHLHEIPYEFVYRYVGRYFPTNISWLRSTCGCSDRDVKHNDIPRASGSLACATSTFSSIRRQRNLTDTVTKERIPLRPKKGVAPHDEHEPDDMYTVYYFEKIGYMTDDDQRHPYRYIPMFRDKKRNDPEEGRVTELYDDVTSFFDPERPSINPDHQSLI